MAIDHKDFMHGAALVAIADSDRFTALNKASVKYGHYVVNHDRQLFIKYSDGQGPGDYSFTFTKGDKERLREQRGGKVFAVLVCGEEVITGLHIDEVGELIDVDLNVSQTIKAHVPRGKSLRFYGPSGSLGPLPRNSFPGRILE
jgi:hypothetical protein